MKRHTNETNQLYNGGAGERVGSSSEWFYMDTGWQTTPLRARVRLSATTGTHSGLDSRCKLVGHTRDVTLSHTHGWRAHTRRSERNATHAPLRSLSRLSLGRRHRRRSVISVHIRTLAPPSHALTDGSTLHEHEFAQTPSLTSHGDESATSGGGEKLERLPTIVRENSNWSSRRYQG